MGTFMVWFPFLVAIVCIPLFSIGYGHFIQALKTTNEQELNDHILATSISWGIIIMAFLFSQVQA